MGENKISANEIVEELLPLLKDYFVAKCLSKGNIITMTFLSGQKITISVSD